MGSWKSEESLFPDPKQDRMAVISEWIASGQDRAYPPIRCLSGDPMVVSGIFLFRAQGKEAPDNIV